MRRHKKQRERRGFSLGSGFRVYVVFLLAGIIFTQALRSPITVVFLWFLILLPFMMLFYALITYRSADVFVESDETTVVKGEEIEYDFRVRNTSILPIPFADAVISIPETDGVRCIEESISMSLFPLGEYRFKSRIVFRYRGEYLIGVGAVYVYDPLRIFCLRHRLDTYNEIYVLPRKNHPDETPPYAPSDLTTDSSIVTGIESSEASNIREYLPGDSLKHIHWKLSSKHDDLEVNELRPNSGKNVYVFCDFASFYPDIDELSAKESVKAKKEPKKKEKRPVKLKFQKKSAATLQNAEGFMEEAARTSSGRAEAAAALAKLREEIKNEADAEASAVIDENGDSAGADVTAVEDEPRAERLYVSQASDYAKRFLHANDILPQYAYDMDFLFADGVSELAIAAVMQEIEANNTVTLMWFDERVESGFASYTMKTYADFDLVFKRFATAPTVPHSMKVTKLPDLIGDLQNPTFRFVTANAGLDTVDEFADAANRMGADTTEVILFCPYERYENPSLRREYIDVCRERFAEAKISLKESSVAPVLGTGERQVLGE